MNNIPRRPKIFNVHTGLTETEKWQRWIDEQISRYNIRKHDPTLYAIPTKKRGRRRSK